MLWKTQEYPQAYTSNITNIQMAVFTYKINKKLKYQ